MKYIEEIVGILKAACMEVSHESVNRWVMSGQNRFGKYGSINQSDIAKYFREFYGVSHT